MGGNTSEPYNQKEFIAQWDKVGENQGRTIWRNRQDNSRQLQQYQIYANNQHDVQKQSNLFQLRRNSKNLVAASYLKSTSKSGLCSTASQGKLFLQKIPIRLQDIKDIPFSDILHLHRQALTGYQSLYSQVGPFKPSQQQIGFNNQGVAKVWLNSDYSRSTPNIAQSSQRAMVRTILQMVESNTDLSTLPPQNPSILNFVYQRKNEVGFEQANGAIRQFADRYNNSFIPTKLDCIDRVGGTQRVFQTIHQQFQGQQLNNQNNHNNQVNYSVVNQAFQPTKSQLVVSNKQPSFVVNGQSNLPLASSKVNAINTSNVVTVNRNFAPIQDTQRTNVVVSNPPFVVSNRPSTMVYQQPIVINQAPQIIRPLQTGSRVNFVNQVRTVRPQQTVVQSPVFVRPPQQQRVIQQIVRNVPVVVQPQAFQIQQRRQVINTNVPVVYQNRVQVQRVQQIPSQTKVQSRTDLNNLNNINNYSRTQVVSSPINVVRTQPVSNSYLNGQSRNNVITSNTVDLIAGGKQFESYNNSAQKFGVTESLNTFKKTEATSNGYGKTEITSNANYGVTQKYGNDVNLQDGKSSEALLRELRQLSSSRKNQPAFETNFDTNVNRNYQAGNNYDNDYSYKYTSNNDYSANNYTDSNQDNQYYGTFNKYSNNNSGNNQYARQSDYSRGLQQNLEMKYSMTQELYENQNGHGNHNHYATEEYQVDFDPEILADMRKLKS